ncbi:MAG: Alternative complex protein [Planctomycetota bacterium]
MLEPTIPPALHPLRLLRRFWLPLILVLGAAAYGAYWFKFVAFNDRGYAPTQPIPFSHKLHAGDLKMDCRYCHSNVDKGKHAGIPATQVCLGCHNEVAPTRSTPAGAEGIEKLKAIAADGTYTGADGIERQGGALHWARVHKLPDHVYFNHAQHVGAGVDCTTCHGPVQSMVVMRQHSDLTMKWCLDCHRKDDYVTRIPGTASGAAAAAEFRVGTANYAVVRERAAQERDAVVVFGGHGSATAPAAAPTGFQAKVQALLRDHPEFRGVPAHKLADLPPHLLPESHRQFYTGPNAWQNAATQCSTCHQ